MSPEEYEKLVAQPAYRAVAKLLRDLGYDTKMDKSPNPRTLDMARRFIQKLEKEGFEIRKKDADMSSQ